MLIASKIVNAMLDALNCWENEELLKTLFDSMATGKAKGKKKKKKKTHQERVINGISNYFQLDCACQNCCIEFKT
jgi:hypothetical protein